MKNQRSTRRRRGQAGVTLIESVGYSHYNALTIKVQKRMKGLTLLSTYTWSSNWDNFYGAARNITARNSHSGQLLCVHPKPEDCPYRSCQYT